MAIPPCRSLFTCLAFAISLAKIEAATFTVTTPGDDGPGSLRQAILEANLSPGPHTITFAIFSDVALRSPLPVVSTDVSIINDRFLGGVGGNGDDGSPPVGRLFECAPGHTIAITGLVLQYTSDTSGGSALLNHGSAVTLRNCRFFSCAGSAVKSSAAATHSARTELIDCSFVMYAPGEQAIDNSSPGPTTLLVTNSSFFGSSVASTDAIVHNRSIATLTNCTFSLDTGSRAGAIAVDNDGSTASLTLRNDTLFGQSGGETIPLVVNSGATTVGNCIFKTSGSTISVANADGATFSSAGHNISSDAAGGDASFQPGGWLDASGDQRNTDPLIDQQPAQNGGATETYALLPGSPSINNADPRRAPPRDGRNYVRQDAPDVGAYEVGAKIPATLGNISTRARVGTDDNVLIAGCIVSVAGHGNRIIARALGPSLPLADRLADPQLEVRTDSPPYGTVTASNDNWQDGLDKQELIDHGIAPSASAEAAAITSLGEDGVVGAAGGTVVVRGVNNSTGIGLAEIYELSGSNGEELLNISTRGLVQAGDDVMIAGFIALGPDSLTVALRALGPSTSSYLKGVLQDPTLQLFDGNGTVMAQNDNWRDSEQQTELYVRGLAPQDDHESALITMLAPGNYTAVVGGVNDTFGVALVEVYRLH